MFSPVKLFRLLNELVFVLLGVLLMWVAMTGHYFLNRRAPAWIGLGIFLIYWGLRAAQRAGRGAFLSEHWIRGGSLALVGAIMLGIAFLPFTWIAPLLIASGGILVLRGIVSAVRMARFP